MVYFLNFVALFISIPSQRLLMLSVSFRNCIVEISREFRERLGGGPICTNFKGERAPKKRIFWTTDNNFLKEPKNAFFGLFFFQNFACCANNLSKWGPYSDLGDPHHSINSWNRPGRDDFFYHRAQWRILDFLEGGFSFSRGEILFLGRLN